MKPHRVHLTAPQRVRRTGADAAFGLCQSFKEPLKPLGCLALGFYIISRGCPQTHTSEGAPAALREHKAEALHCVLDRTWETRGVHVRLTLVSAVKRQQGAAKCSPVWGRCLSVYVHISLYSHTCGWLGGGEALWHTDTQLQSRTELYFPRS